MRRLRCLKITQLVSIALQLLLALNLVLTTSVVFSPKLNRLLESYNSQNGKSCDYNETLSGRCMFMWDCHRTDGQSLGLCKLEPSIYGTCCYHNKSANEVTTHAPSPTEAELDYQDAFQNVSVEVAEPEKPSKRPNAYAQCGVTDLGKAPVTLEPPAQKSRNAHESRIVGGDPALVGQWPWVVSIRRASLFGYTSTHSCGGIVVNELWIVTAAHCVAALSKSIIRVRLGDLDFKSESDNELLPYVERKIERKIIYPTYNFTSFENDLSLLKLAEPITFSANVRPLCLPLDKDQDYVGQNGTIVGWGRISENGQYSQNQLYVRVPIISNSDCVQMFKNSGRDERIPGHFICAGYALGGKDGCQGDSGGPLTVQDSNGIWYLAGIMSWGIGCGEPQQPGVYTRITLFTDWIIQHSSLD